MITLQEQFEKDFPDKSVKEIDADYKYFEYPESNFTNHDLDLRGYKNLTKLSLGYNNITSINLPECENLIVLFLQNNCLTNIDFLNNAPNFSKLEKLEIDNNNIQPTDISIFSKFVDLEVLKIGTFSLYFSGDDGIESRFNKKHNKFYGSLKSYQNLTKLEKICIEATDVNEGLEYLPFSLALTQATKVRKYDTIECSPHETNAKCKAIQDQLRPFNYDLEAWQLAHPEKMLISRPELFANPDSKDKWLTALKNKVEQSKQELSETDKEKVKRIVRLESKILELEKTKTTLSQQTQTEFSNQNKSIQTDLTMEQIEKWEQTDKNKTLYQKFVEKHSGK